MTRRHASQFLLVLAILSSWVFMAGIEQMQPSWGGECIVTFPNAELEEEIRQAIDKPTGDILCAELAALTSFSSCGCEEIDCDEAVCERDPINNPDYNPITNISGLQYCTNLTALELPYNEISNLSPLAGLSKLTHLELDGNDIVDVGPLGGLVNLTTLELIDNDIFDISPLAGLSNVSVLKLDSNLIFDISTLSGLTTLSQVDLEDNLISDISPLVENAGLEFTDTVDIEGNPLSETSCCVHVPALEARGVIVTVAGSCPYVCP